MIDLATDEGRSRARRADRQRRRADAEPRPARWTSSASRASGCCKDYPALISCTISGYGDDGPYAASQGL